MAAFAASDVGMITGFWSDVITVLLSLTGLGMGILDTVGGGLLFNGWSRVFPKNGQAWSLRFKILTLCVFTLVLSGLIILVPFTMSRLAHESVLDALGGKFNIWAWIWSTMVNLIPYVLVAGVFTGNKIVEGLEQETSGTTSRTNVEVSKRFRNTSETNSVSMGRPSLHQDRVFEFMEYHYSENNKVPTFTEVMQSLELPQSTASRLREKWIELKGIRQ
jgi:hypothetical protein